MVLYMSKLQLGLILLFIPVINSAFYFLAGSVNYEKSRGLMIVTLLTGLLTFIVALVTRKLVSKSPYRIWISIALTYFIVLLVGGYFVYSYMTLEEQKFIFVIIAFGSMVVAPTVLGMNFILHRVLDKKTS